MKSTIFITPLLLAPFATAFSALKAVPFALRSHSDGSNSVLGASDKLNDAYSIDHIHSSNQLDFRQNDLEEFVEALLNNIETDHILDDLFEGNDDDFLEVVEIEEIFIDERGNIVEEADYMKKII